MALSFSAKQSGYVFLGTLFSRLLGFVRVILLATTLGFTRISDSYSIANNAPNMMYELILGGVIASTMVPFFVQQYKRKDRHADDALNTFAITASLFLTLIALALSPLIAKGMTALNTSESADAQTDLVLFFLLFFLPQIFFYAVTATMQAYLSARQRFVAAAFAPIINNVIVIGVLAYLTTRKEDFDVPLSKIKTQDVTLILAISTTLGVVLIAALLCVAYVKAGGRFRFGSITHPNVKLLISRSKWMVAYAFANQIALFLIITFANAYEGGVLMYTTAFLFSQLPHGLLAVTIMTTMVPRIAHTIDVEDDTYATPVANNDTLEITKKSATGLIAVMSWVSAIGIAVAIPAMVLLTAHGEISTAEAEQTGRVLIAFLTFLPVYSLYLFIVRIANALHKTKELFYINVFQNIINIVLALILREYFDVVGLAFAFSVSYLVVITASLSLISKPLKGSILDKGLMIYLVVGSIIGAGLGYLVSISLDNIYMALAGGIISSVAVQLTFAFLNRSKIKPLLSMAFSKQQSNSEPVSVD